MIQSKDVAEFVDGHPVDIDDARPAIAKVGVPAVAGVEGHVALNRTAGTDEVGRTRNGKGAVTEGITSGTGA